MHQGERLNGRARAVPQGVLVASTGAVKVSENNVGVRVQSRDASLLAGSGIAWTLGESLRQPATRYSQYSDPCARAARNSLAVMSTPVNAAATVPFTSTRCNRPFELR